MKRFELDSFVLQKLTDSGQVAQQCYPEATEEKKFPNEKRLQDTIIAKKSVQGEFIQVLHVGKSHWLTVSNKHCPPGTICVYNSTKGAITADAKNQVVTIMHYKEAEIVLEVMDVDLQISGSDCSLQAMATAYKLCASNVPTAITWEHDQLRSHV